MLIKTSSDFLLYCQVIKFIILPYPGECGYGIAMLNWNYPNVEGAGTWGKQAPHPVS